jgi:hypothetical protein
LSEWDRWKLFTSFVPGEVEGVSIPGDPPVPTGGSWFVSSDGHWAEVWSAPTATEPSRRLRIYLRQKKFRPRRRAS